MSRTRSAAGTATTATAAGRWNSADRPFAVGARVKHPEWGRGAVQTYEEGDRIVVLFETAGYKTLSLALVADHHLLRPVDNSRAS